MSSMIQRIDMLNVTAVRKKIQEKRALRKEFRGKKRAHRTQKRNQRQGRATTMQYHDPGKWKNYKERGVAGRDELRSGDTPTKSTPPKTDTTWRSTNRPDPSKRPAPTRRPLPKLRGTAEGVLGGGTAYNWRPLLQDNPRLRTVKRSDWEKRF
jgi:hypothetical protein